MHKLFSRMAFGAILLLGCSTIQAAVIKLVPSASSVQVGSAFTVDVVAEDIVIGGYQLDISYAPALVSMPLNDPVTFGAALGYPDFSFAFGMDEFRTVAIDELSFLGEAELRNLQGNPPQNSFLLATLHFSADAIGSAVFDLSSAIVSLEGDILNPTLTGATIDIVGSPTNPVPEPGTWSVAAMGVAGLWLWRRS